jgi:hypothetical protein
MQSVCVCAHVEKWKCARDCEDSPKPEVEAYGGEEQRAAVRTHWICRDKGGRRPYHPLIPPASKVSAPLSPQTTIEQILRCCCK